MTTPNTPVPSETPSPDMPPKPENKVDEGIFGFTPWAVLKAAIKAVPALKYALGVLGIVSAFAIVKGFGIDFRVAVFGAIVMVVLMTALVIFAALTKVKSPQMQLAALILMWSFLGLTILSAMLLFTSTFFSYPKPITQLFGLGSGESATDQSILVGKWRYMGRTRGSWTQGGIIEVSRSGQEIKIKVISQKDLSDYGRIDNLEHQNFDGKEWRFKCVYGDGSIGYFILERLSNVLFEGKLHTTLATDTTFQQRLEKIIE